MFFLHVIFFLLLHLLKAECGLKFSFACPTIYAESSIKVQLTVEVIAEPRYEKTGLRGLRPGPTQNGLHSHRRWLEVEISDLDRRGIVLAI